MHVNRIISFHGETITYHLLKLFASNVLAVFRLQTFTFPFYLFKFLFAHLKIFANFVVGFQNDTAYVVVLEVLGHRLNEVCLLTFLWNKYLASSGNVFNNQLQMRKIIPDWSISVLVRVAIQDWYPYSILWCLAFYWDFLYVCEFLELA